MKKQVPIPPFQTLIDAHASTISRFLRGMLAAGDVDDAVQETFLAALRAYPGFDGANPRAWLLTIARRKAIDQYRSSSRRPDALIEPDQVESNREIDGIDEDGALWAAVADLPPKQRAAIVLRFALDLRYREVGEALECSEDAARRNVHEGIKGLRVGYEVTTERPVQR
jgi:RNA polymerase sigma factor (sigma-70 family)